ncbi:MAG: hypothetical protein ABW252_22640, partial [Polyangiales bacterium]
GPPWLGVVNANLLAKLGRIEQAIRHLELLRGTVRDPEGLRAVEGRLKELYDARSRDLRAADPQAVAR